MSFDPSIAADRKLYGVNITRQEYPVGVAGVHLSLQQIAGKIREGSRTPSIRQFAEMVVRQNGPPPSEHLGQSQAAAILFQYVVDNVRYRPDPMMTEWTQSAAITLCVAGAPMCIPVEDCDGLAVALGSLLGAYGIEVRVVKQTFGAGDQEHVLIEYKDESGRWIPLDPTPRSPSLQPGQKAVASHEDYIDPWDPSAIGMVAGTPEAEFIGVGRTPQVLTDVGGFPGAQEERFMAFVDGAYEEVAHGKVWRRVGENWVEKQTTPEEFVAGLPRVSFVNPMPAIKARFIGAPGSLAPDFTQATTDLANQVDTPITAGDTYMAASEYANAISAYQAAGQAGAVGVGPEIDAVGQPQTTVLTQKAWKLNGQLAAISSASTSEADARTAQSLVKQISAFYHQAIAVGATPLPAGGVLNTGIPPIVAIVGVGVVGGLGYAIYTGRHKGKKRR